MIESSRIGKIIKIKFNDPAFDGIKRFCTVHARRKDKAFLDKIEAFMAMENLDDLGPLYYCHKCQRLEDGTHRSWVRMLRGELHADVFVGRHCFSQMHFLHHRLHEMMAAGGIDGPKDRLWTSACRDKKWGAMQRIDFAGKDYLDVGSQSGYSCFRGWNSGARRVVGVEIRNDILAVAEHMRAALHADDLQFINADWLAIMDSMPSFNIISCMGLMHYFEPMTFEKVLLRLCALAKETLILELRIWYRDPIGFYVRGSQSLVGEAHLLSLISQGGFRVIGKTAISQNNQNTPGKRELWIMEKKHDG